MEPLITINYLWKLPKFKIGVKIMLSLGEVGCVWIGILSSYFSLISF